MKIGRMMPTASPTITNPTISGVLSLPDGLVGTPSLTFTSDTNTGVFWRLADVLSLVTGGTERLTIDADGDVGIGTTTPGAKVVARGADIGTNSFRSEISTGNSRRLEFGYNTSDFGDVFAYDDTASAGKDLILGRLGGNVGIRTTAPARILSVGLGNGQQFSLGQLTELTTIAAAATTDTTITIPANTVVYAVSTRVTTVIPTAATFDVGVALATTRYGTGISTAANTTSPGTLDAVRFYSAAAAIRITPNLTPADTTGRLRVTIYFYEVTPATS